MPSTGIAYSGICRRACYAMPGTDTANRRNRSRVSFRTATGTARRLWGRLVNYSPRRSIIPCQYGYRVHSRLCAYA
eukprot:3933400-Rhodomonas_salina.3